MPPAKLKLTVRGVIENMSWFTGDDGKRYELFGAGGGQQLAGELGVPLLAQVPLVSALREGGDKGLPVVVAEPGGEVAACSISWRRPSSVSARPGSTARSSPSISWEWGRLGVGPVGSGAGRPGPALGPRPSSPALSVRRHTPLEAFCP